MHSIRTKITFLNILAIFVAILVTSTIGSIYVATLNHSSVEQSISLLCESGKNNINNYLKSVEQSADTVSSTIGRQLDEISDADFNSKLSEEVADARKYFNESALNTNGVLTYYYRLDPEITSVTNEKGFWYVYEDDRGFVEHEVTDISDDHNECVWFYEPKTSGEPIWLSPYKTDNLDVIVISYNVPVYRHNSFIGVVGIEINYHTLGEQIKDIKVLESGFAYIVRDDDGSIIYHPYIDILSMPEDERPTIPSDFLDAFFKGEHHVVYSFQGVTKHAHWLDLSNNMSIVVAVPQQEIINIWAKVVWQIVGVAAALIIAFGVLSYLFTRQLTKPLKELTIAAEQINEGNYKVELNNKSNDEIGRLTTTMSKLVNHLGDYIEDLNSVAYSDALTQVKNKSSFDLALKELQEKVDNNEVSEFAIVMFDCDGLKQINDQYGHDKGNIYLKNSSLLMTRVFHNSDIYRIGGDEFAAILVDSDYTHRDELRKKFYEKAHEICTFAKEGWEKISVSIGIASYDPEIDNKVDDVLIHADHLMYQDKRSKKKKSK